MRKETKVGIITKYSPPLKTVHDIVANLKQTFPVLLVEIRAEELRTKKSVGLSKVDLPSGIPTYHMWDGSSVDRLLANVPAFKHKNFEQAILKHNISVLHAQFAALGYDALNLKKKFNLPLIVHCRGEDVFRDVPKDRGKTQRLRSLFRNSDLLLTVSEHMRQHLINLGCPEEKVLTHYQGIDLSLFKPNGDKNIDKDDEIRVVMCGRFTEKKGFEDGIKAFALCARKRKNVKLQIIGDGPLKKRIGQEISSLRINEKVELLGQQSPQQVAQILSEGHIFMMAYITPKDKDTEGVPNVLKEASSSGLPVISTYHGGIPEVVISGETGFLLKETDINGISERLKHLIENPEMRKRFGENGRRLIEVKFDLSKQIEKLEEIYLSLRNGQ